MSQINEDPQSEQGQQSKDAGTSEAPPHQVRQDESHGSFSDRPLGEMILKPLHDGGAACVQPQQEPQNQGRHVPGTHPHPMQPYFTDEQINELMKAMEADATPEDAFKLVNDSFQGPKGPPPPPLRTTPQMNQSQHQINESPYSKVIAESLHGGQSIDKKGIDFLNMSNEDLKRSMADVKI